MVEIYQIDEDLYAIDLDLLQRRKTSAAYVLLADGISIIETGVPASAPHILEGLVALGIPRQEVRRILETPGHAPHHLCFYDEGSRRLFAGEAMGLYYEEIDLLIPAVAPPDFNLEAYLATLERIRGLGVELALLTQFGPSRRVGWLLTENAAQLRHGEQVIRRKLAEGKGARQIIVELQEENAPLKAHLDPAFIKFIFSAMTMGYLLYFEEKREKTKNV